MDERVEITDAPQPLLPHPDAPITAHADSYSKANDAEIMTAPRRKATLRWAALSLIFVIGAVACVVLDRFNITPLGYAFDRAMKPHIMGWVIIILTYSSVVFSVISCVLALGRDESLPTYSGPNYVAGCLSLFISVGAALLLTAAIFIFGSDAHLL